SPSWPSSRRRSATPTSYPCGRSRSSRSPSTASSAPVATPAAWPCGSRASSATATTSPPTRPTPSRRSGHWRAGRFAGVIELTRGQEMVLARDDGTSLGRLTMGLGWDKKPGAGALSGSNTPDVDLDASAVQYAGEQLFDLAFFNHLETRDGSVTHLGDNISGRGDGDDEQITIDLARVYPKVDT